MKIKLVIIILFCGQLVYGKPFKDDPALKDMISKLFEQFRAPAKVLNVNLGKIVLSESSSSHAVNGDPDITIKYSDIVTYTKGENETFKKLFIQYVIAHEIGHKIQFNGYRRDVIAQSKGEGRIFLECNADILSGFLVTDEIATVESHNMLRENPNADLKAFNLKNQQEMMRVYQRIFDMDQVNVKLKTHPSHLQRLMAFKAGIEVGNVYNMFFVIPPAGGPALEYYNFNKELLKIIGNAIDFDPANPNKNNPLMWAHSEAVRIIHENNGLARNIFRFGTKIKHTHSGDDLYYDYSFQVYNGNNVSVRFGGRVYSVTSNEDGEIDLIKGVPIDGFSFDRTIAPKASIMMSGRVKYVSTGQLNSTLVLPGDKQSLYFVLDSNNPNVDTIEHSSTDNNFTVWDDQTLINIDDHIKEIFRNRDKFPQLTRGMSVSGDSTYEEAASDILEFEPTFKAGMEDDQIFGYSPRLHKFIYQFYACETPSFAIGQQHFNEIVAKIKAANLNKLTAQPLVLNDNRTKEEFWDENNTRAIMVTLKKNYPTENWIVDVKIYGKD